MSVKKRLYNANDLRNALPNKSREIFAKELYNSVTCGISNGYLQANVVIIDSESANDFKRFCELNDRPAPLLEILSKGNPYTSIIANNADIRDVLPKYRYYFKDKNGSIKYKELFNIKDIWNNNLVTFFLGCSYTFEDALIRNGVNLRHIELNKNVAMYDTNIKTNNYNGFGKNMVVSMRPIKKNMVNKVYKICNKFKKAHGSPLYFGNPNNIGINDINKPEYGESVAIKCDEYPVYWACGVTTQAAIMNALQNDTIKFAITHAPGHMFITDIKAADADTFKFRVNKGKL